MIKTSIEKAKNLLNVTYSGRITPKETEAGLEKLQSVLAKMPPGFRLLTDLSGLESMELACAPHLERMMDLCNRMGVETVVRIIPDPNKDIGMKIMSLFHYPRRVRIVTCETMGEAIRSLED
jgi:anti-anti-sigma regulatory factor